VPVEPFVVVVVLAPAGALALVVVVVVVGLVPQPIDKAKPKKTRRARDCRIEKTLLEN
jgi:hypothetical protein